MTKDKNDLTKRMQTSLVLQNMMRNPADMNFDAKTGASRGDKGTFFVTNDGRREY